MWQNLKKVTEVPLSMHMAALHSQIFLVRLRDLDYEVWFQVSPQEAATGAVCYEAHVCQIESEPFST